jgi:hypothetical protein
MEIVFSILSTDIRTQSKWDWPFTAAFILAQMRMWKAERYAFTGGKKIEIVFFEKCVKNAISHKT